MMIVIDVVRNFTKQMLVYKVLYFVVCADTVQECPTLWRLYEYLTEEAKVLVLQTRQEKRNLVLGEGGEGYIADNQWCYNCGNFGHWGDVSSSAGLQEMKSSFFVSGL